MRVRIWQKSEQAADFVFCVLCDLYVLCVFYVLCVLCSVIYDLPGWITLTYTTLRSASYACTRNHLADSIGSNQRSPHFPQLALDGP